MSNFYKSIKINKKYLINKNKKSIKPQPPQKYREEVAGIKTKSLIGLKPTAILGEWFTNPISVLKASLKK